MKGQISARKIKEEVADLFRKRIIEAKTRPELAGVNNELRNARSRVGTKNYVTLRRQARVRWAILGRQGANDDKQGYTSGN